MSNYSVSKLFAGDAALGTEVTVKGWVRSRRTSKAGISFVALHDGTCFDPIQLVIPDTLENYEEVTRLGSGCSIIGTGELVESQGKGQSVEIQTTSLEVVGWVDDPEAYPISKKRHTFEYLRTQAHLRPRTNSFGAITRLRATIANSIHNYFYNNEFYWVNTPLITHSDCEGAGEMFRVSTLDTMNTPINDQGKTDFEKDFFGQETFLTVSGQLNVESHALAMSKVYTFGPTFRAENSHTSRHLSEFWMVEPEIAFADLEDDAALAEDFLKSVFRDVLNQRGDDMEFFNQRIDKDAIGRLERVINNDFVHMDYTDAIKILQDSGKKFEFPVQWGFDLQSEHERFLCEEYVNAPVILKNYPKDIKAFYMRLNDDEKTVAAMDVLAPGIGEIIGGSQREDRLDILDARMDPRMAEDLWWYRDLRKYGSVPHAGFGLGFERLISYVSGMENIRDVIPFPRTPGSCQF